MSGIAAIAIAILVSAVGGARASRSARINGHIRYETFAYPDPDHLDGTWENFFEAVLRGRGRLTSSLTYKFEARLVADDAKFTAGGFSLRNGELRRPYFSLTSAVLAYRPFVGLRVGIGKQIVNWSVMDGLQPANLMVGMDESEFFRRVEEGVYSVTVHAEHGTTYLDLVVTPVLFVPARLPQGRWNIVPAEDVGRRKALPPIAAEETQAGLRLGTQLGMLDLALIGYVGRDWAAVFIPELVFVGGRDPFDLVIVDTYPRLRAGGCTASYPLGEAVLLRTEVVYYSSPDDFRDNFVHTVAGAEYTRGDWRMNLEYMRDDQTAKASEEVTDKGERRFFRSFILGGLNYDAGGRWEGHVSGGYDTEGKFLIGQLEVACLVWRNLEVTLRGELIDAYGSGYFDTVRHEDRLGARLTYYF